MVTLKVAVMFLRAVRSEERERCAALCRAAMPAEGVIRRTLLDVEREIQDA